MIGRQFHMHNICLTRDMNGKHITPRAQAHVDPNPHPNTSETCTLTRDAFDMHTNKHNPNSYPCSNTYPNTCDMRVHQAWHAIRTIHSMMSADSMNRCYSSVFIHCMLILSTCTYNMHFYLIAFICPNSFTCLCIYFEHA